MWQRCRLTEKSSLFSFHGVLSAASALRIGNTEEKAHRLNMGCKARGQPGQPFSHKTGHGYVKAHRGFYHDAIFVNQA